MTPGTTSQVSLRKQHERSPGYPMTKDGTAAELADHMFDPSAVGDLAALRPIWPGKLIVKGVQHLDDALALVDAGADAIVVSNHGRRQLDRAVAP